MKRREFLIYGSKMALGAALAGRAWGAARTTNGTGADQLTLFLSGDVMLGRGIDQILPHSVDPRLHEPYVQSARTYVELAEDASGPIPEGVSYDYVWGDALDELARVDPDARIINLETAVTTSDDWWQGKGIHYRMHPQNVPVLEAAGVDVAVLGNNHVLDWGREGILETLAVLQERGIGTPGAGREERAAAAPAVVQSRSGRVLVFSYGSPTAGVPPDWSAGEDEPGVNVLSDLGERTAQQVAERVQGHRQVGDRVVISLHWGGNWGYQVPPEQREFAHRLIDAGAADVIHGHSSHHPKGMEVYSDRLILYGCGDFLNDYEGIGGHEEFRPELTLMYLPVLDVSGALVSLDMVPMRIHRFRLERAGDGETRWLAETLDRESRAFGARVEQTAQKRLVLRWA